MIYRAHLDESTCSVWRLSAWGVFWRWRLLPNPPRPAQLQRPPSPDPPAVFPLHRETCSTSKCFLFETQKCKIAEISNIFRSATILPLCTKDLMINVHTYKNTVCITYVQYMCKMDGVQRGMELISGVQTANTKASWFSFKKQHKGNTWMDPRSP